MATLNCNIPTLDCFVRAEFLYDGDLSRRGQYLKAAAFSISSVPGRALGFQVMLENGAVYDRLPVTALCHKQVKAFPIYVSQMWDCPSVEVSVIEYDFLKGLCVDVHMIDADSPFGDQGNYVMTFDWHEDSVSEGVGPLGHKCAHLIALNSGDYVLYPNNRLCFHSPAWVTKPWSVSDRPDYKINTTKYVCEARRRVTTEEYFYGVKVSR